MTIATYRGCKYDTDSVKEEYLQWYSKTHAPSRQKNTYRGVQYRPCRNQEIAK